jgi:hypothetical protein
MPLCPARKLIYLEEDVILLLLGYGSSSYALLRSLIIAFCRRPSRYVPYKGTFVPYDSTYGAPDQGQTLDVWESQTAESALRDEWIRIVPRRNPMSVQSHVRPIPEGIPCKVTLIPEGIPRKVTSIPEGIPCPSDPRSVRSHVRPIPSGHKETRYASLLE